MSFVIAGKRKCVLLRYDGRYDTALVVLKIGRSDKEMRKYAKKRKAPVADDNELTEELATAKDIEFYEPIPGRFYQPVAGILARIYRKKNSRNGKRKARK